MINCDQRRRKSEVVLRNSSKPVNVELIDTSIKRTGLGEKNQNYPTVGNRIVISANTSNSGFEYVKRTSVACVFKT